MMNCQSFLISEIRKGLTDMKLPSDAYMLLSVINMKLRDFYGSMDELCKSECADRTEIDGKLAEIGYKYDETRNCYKQNNEVNHE